MSLFGTKQQPLDMRGAGKDQLRTQFAALCYRMRAGEPEVLLVTTRRTKRWIIPRGWPLHGSTPSATAQTEALEEAGAEGKMHNTCIGIYSYIKIRPDGTQTPVMVAVFPLKVKKLRDSYREAGQRKRRWFPLKKAAAHVHEPELQQIIRNFDPKVLRSLAG
ncbi:MAG: NUDIX hydrolase [Brevirhabdus sp.]